jgi:hypothetical protein
LTADIDKAFSMLVEWCGELGVEIVRVFHDPWSEKSVGNPNSNETLTCVVGENGDSIKIDILPSPQDSPLGENKTFFAKVFKTVTLPCVGYPSISATASASYVSFISFVHAEEQAGILALQAANTAAVEYKISNPC